MKKSDQQTKRPYIKPNLRHYEPHHPALSPGVMSELSTVVDNCPPARIGADDTQPTVSSLLQTDGNAHKLFRAHEGIKLNNAGCKPEK